MTAYYVKGERKPLKVFLDGGCGFSTMQDIAKYIGLNLKFCGESSNSTKYILTDNKQQTKRGTK